MLKKKVIHFNFFASYLKIEQKIYNLIINLAMLNRIKSVLSI